MFAGKEYLITPALVGTEGRAMITLGKEKSVIGWANFEGKQQHAKRVHLWEGELTVKAQNIGDTKHRGHSQTPCGRSSGLEFDDKCPRL